MKQHPLDAYVLQQYAADFKLAIAQPRELRRAAVEHATRPAFRALMGHGHTYEEAVELMRKAVREVFDVQLQQYAAAFKLVAATKCPSTE